MTTCTYKFKDASGEEVTITGQADMKAFLANGGLEQLLPGKVLPWESKPKAEIMARMRDIYQQEIALNQRKQVEGEGFAEYENERQKLRAEKDALGAAYRSDKRDDPSAGDGSAESGASTNDDADQPSRDTFSVARYDPTSNEVKSESFARGEYVRIPSVDAGAAGKVSFGDIEGVSHAKKMVKVRGVWYSFGQIYKAERPESPKTKTVPMSEALDSANKKYGGDTTEADRILTLADIDTLVAGLNDGTVSADAYKAAWQAFQKSADTIKAGLHKLTKPQLLDKVGGTLAYRMKGENKPEIVASVFKAARNTFALGRNYGPSSYVLSASGMKAHEEAKEKALADLIDATTDEDLKRYADDIAAARAERSDAMDALMESVKDPKTLDDFRTYMRVKGREGKTDAEARQELTPEQRIAYDNLLAEESRNGRAGRKDAQQTEVRAAGQTTSGEVVTTKHTKTGEDLFVVRAADRVDRDIYNQWNAAAKRLGGWYSSYRGGGAVPGFQFKSMESAQAFLKFLGGDVSEAQEVVQQRRDSFADDRSQSAVERLNEMADRMEERADASLSQERKANTERRARMAASAEASASAEKAMAKTMRNIAAAISEGRAKFLDKIRQKTQIEMLASFLSVAKYNELTKRYPSYGDFERHRGEPMTAETADYATFPKYTASRSDLARLGRELELIDGAKLLGQRILKVADDATSEYLAFVKDNIYKVTPFTVNGGKPAIFASRDDAERAIARSSLRGKAMVYPVKRGQNVIVMSPQMAQEKGLWQGGSEKRFTLTDETGEELTRKVAEINARGGKASLPYQFSTTREQRAKLSAIGIETPAEFRAALREFIAMRESAEAPSKIKQLERAMVGRKNDGLDFFPTPAGVAQEMIDAAGIEEGMTVLEPSAGMGHIAEQIREAGVDPDVAEFSSDRRELLEAKGFRVVGNDFMSITPRDFTYGDVFRDKDGVEGVMRGSGGMGSNRVGFYPLGKEDRLFEWRDRDELVGVRKSGNDSGYDRIIMNPPFSDRRDAEHVRHAFDLLKPGGRIVAIMGEGVFFGQDKKAESFREWLDSVGGSSEKLPDGTFLDPSLPVNTGVNARMVVIDKPADAPAVLRTDALPDTITVNGVERPTTNSTGKPIHPTEEGVRKFWEWFAGSKVVDEQGRPLVMYHGTKAGNIAEFLPSAMGAADNQSKSMDLVERFRKLKSENGRIGYMDFRSGSFFSADPSYAEHYAGDDGGVMYPVYIKAENPVYIDQVTGKKSADSPAVTLDALAMRDGKTFNEVAVIDPGQVKSAIGNAGTFDPASPDIRMRTDNSRLAGRAGWTPERTDSLLRAFSYPADATKTKAYAAWVSPSAFLDATTPTAERGSLEGEAGPLDRAKLSGETQPIYLEVEEDGEEGLYRIVGHEGRHRMMALRDAGVDRVPVVIRTRSAVEAADVVSEPYFSAQRFSDGTKGRRGFDVQTMTPISMMFADDIREEFSAQADDASRLAFRDTSALRDGESIPRDQAEAFIRSFVAEFPGAPPIMLADSFSQLPKDLQADAIAQGSSPRRAKGALKAGKAFVVLNNHHSMADLEATVFHEILGHTGTRKLLGPQFSQELNKLFVGLGGYSGLERIMEARGMGQQFEGYFRGIQQARASNPDAWTDALAKSILTEEVFAHIAEQKNAKQLRDRFMALVGMVRDWLRKHGFMDLASLGESDIVFMLQHAREGLRDGSGIVRDGATVGENEIVGEDGRPIAKEGSPEYEALKLLSGRLGLRERSGPTVFKDGLRDDENQGQYAGMDDAKNVAGKQAPNPAGDVEQGGATPTPAIATLKSAPMFGATVSVEENGRVSIAWPGWGGTGPYLRDKAITAVMNAFKPKLPDGVFWRFTNNKNEASLAAKKELRPSTDHSSNTQEEGLSVTDGAHYSVFGYKYGYQVRGEVIGYGADGEPLLDVETLEPVTKILNSADIVKLDSKSRIDALKAKGWTVEQYKAFANGTFKLHDIDKDGPLPNEQSTSARPDVAVFRTDTSPRGKAADDVFLRTINTAGGRKTVRDHLADAFSNVTGESAKTLNWWQRTIGSQYGKAKSDKDFGRVYDAAHAFLDGVSAFAKEASERASGILPHLDTWRDVSAGLNVKKQWADSQDYQAIAPAIFDGTLANGTTGKVWTDEQLRDKYDLNDKQIGHYREFRAAVDFSLETLAASEMARLARASKMDAADRDMGMDDALSFYLKQLDPRIKAARDAVEGKGGEIVARHAEERAALEEADAYLTEGAADLLRNEMWSRHDKEIDEVMGAERSLENLRASFTEKVEQIRKLQSEGYAPLMRFGQYTVDVARLDDEGHPLLDEDGNPDRPFFGMFESESEARKAEKILTEEYPGYSVTRGVLSTEANQLYRGLTPETAEMFARLLGTDENEAFQAYLKQAVANRSAMKRLINRMGIEGFATDVPRVLSAFITSNARLSSGNWHFGEMSKAVEAIPKHKGDVKTDAVKLMQYVQNPVEEAAGLRGFLFFSFLGGSVASAVVNLTQTFTTTLPYLSQFGAGDVAKALPKAMALSGRMMKKGLDAVSDKDLKDALRKASDEGVVDPQEIHLLMAEAGGNGASVGLSGLAGAINKEWATPAARVTRSLTQAWGMLFGAAEKYNRHVAFIAAWDVAPEGVDRYEFAKNAVTETQFDYTKASRPNWARGAVGATLFTFKTFSINYVEFMSRLPPRERAIALGVLFLLAGMSGMPGADDLDDVVDTVAQKMGYNWNNTAARHAWLVRTLGTGGADFVERGISSALPLDVSARLGMGNLVPGTGVLQKSNVSPVRDVQEFFGPAGSVVAGFRDVFDNAGSGKGIIDTALPLMPKMFKDLHQAVDMVQTGQYRDMKGRKVVDVDGVDAVLKGVGFQPNSVASPRRVERMLAQSAGMQRVIRQDISELWARGVAEQDAEKVASARTILREWNEKNPESKITMNPTSIAQRVRAMRLTSADRLVKATPKDMRSALAAEMAVQQ